MTGFRCSKYIILSLFIISFFSFTFVPANAWQNVFCNISLFGTPDLIRCEGLRDTITFKEGSGITIDLDPTNQIVTWTASTTGDGNTAQIADAGNGLGLFSSRFNATMNYLKSIECGSNMSCISNSTVITISATSSGGDVTGASNFKVNSITAASKQFLTGFNNATTSGDFTRTTFAINNQTVAKDFQIVGIHNTTGAITRNQFSVNNVSTTCSGSDKVSAVSIDNATGYVIVTCSAVTVSGGATSLAANVTLSTIPSVDTNIWTIPLTANSGNSISGVVNAITGTTGNAVRLAINVTAPSNTNGYCKVTQVSTTTTDAIDNIVMNTLLTGRATNTGETAWIGAANVAMPIKFDCALKSGASPGNLRIWGTQEISGTASSVKAGSYYIKTP